MIDTPINVPPRPVEQMIPPGPVEMPSDVTTADVNVQLKRLLKHHRLASAASSKAFEHIVLASVAVVLLKAASEHGEFRTDVAAKIRGITTRTITRYRRTGEQFFSAVMGKKVSGSGLRSSEQHIDPSISTDGFIVGYLRQHDISSTEDLAKHAESRLPDSTKSRTKVVQPPSVKVRLAVERVLKKMDPEERNKVWQELDLLRMEFPPLDTAEPETGLEIHEQPALT